jgi:hypothetical protein
MLKKVLVTVIAAGTLSVPLAGVAMADPSNNNPGVPGNVNSQSGGFLPATPPGQLIQQGFVAPGQLGKIVSQELSPGHLK